MPPEVDLDALGRGLADATALDVQDAAGWHDRGRRVRGRVDRCEAFLRLGCGLGG